MSENDVTAAPPQGQPAPAQPAQKVVLPEVEREYHQFYRTPYFRWWRPLVAIAMFAVTWFVAAQVIVLAGLGIAGELDLEALMQGKLNTGTPAFFAVNNVTIIAAIPLAWAAHRVVFGQRIGWLSSVTGRFRWTPFWRFMALAAPVILVGLAVQLVVEADQSHFKILPETWFLLAVVLLTTPLQAAGEEFVLRGLGARAIGSWFPSRQVGLIVATIITALAFMLFHGAGDPWLNAFYLVFALCTSLLVWRTGGLEGAIALHIANNVVSLVVVSFLGIEGLFNREAGVADAWSLVNMAAVLGATALILWQAKRLGLQARSAPAAVEPGSH